MVVPLAYLAFVLHTTQAPQKPFKVTAQLGVQYTLGVQEVVHGSKEKIDTGTMRILTLSSARLAAIYPNSSENVSAGAGEKLLIMCGVIKNPSSVETPFSSRSFLSIRFWDGKKSEDFKYAGIYDPETHHPVHANLKKGQSAAFECVVRIPAKFDSYRIGFHYRYPANMAWYDLGTKIGKITSVFSPEGLTLVDLARVPKDQPFDFDTFRMKVRGATEPSMIGGVAKGDQPLVVVSVEVTNAMLLPARWGWQYVAPELVMKDGAILAGMRDLIDRATDKTWSGDLPVGATMTAQFVFRPAKGQIPVAFRLTMLSSGRTIEVPL